MVKTKSRDIACFVLLIVFTSNIGAAAQTDTLYEKRFPDGDIVYVVKQSKSGHVPSEKQNDTFQLGGEYITDTYSLYLKVARHAESEILWTKAIRYPSSPHLKFPLTGTLRLWDVFLGKGEAYVLYFDEGVVRVDCLRKASDQRWVTSSSQQIARFSETRPIFGGLFLIERKPQISLDVLGSDQTPQNEVWTLSGDKWKRK